ncbi:hypothetical protein [Rubellimicrobium roseum]|uniref:Roadblock/LC7 domain-containing protein n=1 Tax=Rubellimicrobium roseum TaxID=687525 RepID=A0A5C4NE14_9RHOB|nr:hypothetical protein [Rubellimicrobium roseum]TNC72981.1 hypothetical protein FHG71_06700 [Rubellimicrobium roseum]
MKLFQRTGALGGDDAATGHSYGARGGGLRRPPVAPPEPDAAWAPRPEVAPSPDPVHAAAPDHAPDPAQAMADRLPELADLPGLVSACLADRDSGLPLGALGDRLDPEAVAASAAQTLRTALRVAEGLDTDDRPEEILATFGSQIHLLRPLDAAPGVLLHLVLDRARTNLGMVRLRLRALDPSA